MPLGWCLPRPGRGGWALGLRQSSLHPRCFEAPFGLQESGVIQLNRLIQESHFATITGGSTPKTTYFHADHLDWRVSTDGTPGSPTYGQVNGQQGHSPFGESWYSTNGNEFVFTSYQRDSESGLDYAMARYYDSSAGRFCSADPLGGDPDDSQSWNRYAYVRNDPINMTDPSGQGWLAALMDALMILTDFLTLGATTPETIQMGIDLQGIQAMTAIGAMTQASEQTTAQGQQNGPPYGPMIRPPWKWPGEYDSKTPCSGQFNVLRGNRRHIGNKQAKTSTGRTMGPHSAAADPAQIDVQDGEQVSGVVRTPGFGNGHATFDHIRDTVNSKDMTDATGKRIPPGDAARAAIRARQPGTTMTIEMEGIGGRSGNPKDAQPGIVYMPPGRPCPEGTSAPPSAPGLPIPF